METPLIEFRNVTKRFNEVTVLDRANLSIYENQITTIIGKSGTGKSVLLKHIIGLLTPDEGTILFRGVPVEKMKRSEWDGYRSKVSYMFQNNALFDSMTVFENVALPLRQTTNMGGKEIEEKVMSRIGQLELADVVRKYPSELSGGMQKRVALARALVTDPAVVLFDEPTTGQDPIRKNVILSMIAHYRKQFGFTAVLISHDIPDVFFVSDRILLLWEGKIAFHGTYDELKGFRHPMIDEFLESLEGLRDELTGLPSKEIFRARYAQTLGAGKADAKGTAVLFRVRVELLTDRLGPQAALEVLKALGKHADRYFSPMGGFSARHSRDGILTMLPYTGIAEGRQLVEDFTGSFHKKVLPAIREIAESGMEVESCLDIFVIAGIIEYKASDDIDRIIETAEGKQIVVSEDRCGNGGDSG